MSSKIFGFFVVFFLIGLLLVGWYFAEVYFNVAPEAFSRVAGYQTEQSLEEKEFSHLNFFDWMRLKFYIIEKRFQAEAERLL